MSDLEFLSLRPLVTETKEERRDLKSSPSKLLVIEPLRDRAVVTHTDDRDVLQACKKHRFKCGFEKVIRHRVFTLGHGLDLAFSLVGTVLFEDK